MHAELESYVEDLALGVLSKIVKAAKLGTFTRGNIALVSLFKHEKMGAMPAQLTEIKSEAFYWRAHQACEHELKRRIAENKGIKTFNILNMLIPLGLDETKIDENLLADLTTFSAKRGDVAHKGFASVTSLPDPRDEKIIVERIIQGLAVLESEMHQIFR